MKFCDKCGHTHDKRTNRTRQYSTAGSFAMPQSDFMHSQVYAPLFQSVIAGGLAFAFAYVATLHAWLVSFALLVSLAVFVAQLGFYKNLFKVEAVEQPQTPPETPQASEQVVHRIEYKEQRQNSATTRLHTPMSQSDFDALVRVAKEYKTTGKFSSSHMVRKNSVCTQAQWERILEEMRHNGKIEERGRAGIVVHRHGQAFLNQLL